MAALLGLRPLALLLLLVQLAGALRRSQPRMRAAPSMGRGGGGGGGGDGSQALRQIHMPLRVMVFVDGTNLYYDFFGGAERSVPARAFGEHWTYNRHVSWPRLPQALARNIEGQMRELQGVDRPVDVVRSVVYTSMFADTAPESRRGRMFSELNDCSAFEVHITETKTAEKCVDIALATDMLYNAMIDAFDVCLLVSGDRDFMPALARVRQAGKRVAIASGMRDRSWFLTDPSFNCQDFAPLFLENMLDDILVYDQQGRGATGAGERSSRLRLGTDGFANNSGFPVSYTKPLADVAGTAGANQGGNNGGRDFRDQGRNDQRRDHQGRDNNHGRDNNPGRDQGRDPRTEGVDEEIWSCVPEIIELLKATVRIVQESPGPSADFDDAWRNGAVAESFVANVERDVLWQNGGANGQQQSGGGEGITAGNLGRGLKATSLCGMDGLSLCKALFTRLVFFVELFPSVFRTHWDRKENALIVRVTEDAESFVADPQDIIEAALQRIAPREGGLSGGPAIEGLDIAETEAEDEERFAREALETLRVKELRELHAESFVADPQDITKAELVRRLLDHRTKNLEDEIEVEYVKEIPRDGAGGGAAAAATKSDASDVYSTTFFGAS